MWESDGVSSIAAALPSISIAGFNLLSELLLILPMSVFTND